MSAALLLAAALSVAGRAEGCGMQPCTVDVAVSADAPTRVQLFVGVLPMAVNGQPLGLHGGYYDGKQWVIGTPVAAWKGELAGAKRARIPLPGGVCAQAQGASLLGVFAGLGTVSLADQPDLPASTPDDVKREYDRVRADLARMAEGPEAAFMEMRQAGRFRLIGRIDCGSAQ
jgi:hypothetical protein